MSRYKIDIQDGAYFMTFTTVEEGYVSRPEDYLYSTAKDYAGMKRPVKVSLIELHYLFYI